METKQIIAEKERTIKDIRYVIECIKNLIDVEQTQLENSQLCECAEQLYAVRKNVFERLEYNRKYNK